MRKYSNRYRNRNSQFKRLLGGLGVILLLVAGWLGVNKAVYVTSFSSRAFELAVVEPVGVLEPAVLANHSERLIASAIFEGLVYYDESNRQIGPLLAEKWEYLEDGKAISIELKRGVKFSNGAELSAALVKASWERNLATTKDWANQCLFLRIAGADEYMAGKSRDIAGIQVTDKYNLQVVFNCPDSAFIYALANPIFWVVDSQPDVPACGTGPFACQQPIGENMLLIRNDAYHRGVPHLSAVNITHYKDEEQALAAYRQGKVDYLDKIPLTELPGLVSEYKGLLVGRPLMEVYWLGFNLNREPYANNYLLRRAINYAIDREAIIQNILGGGYLPAKGVIPAGSKAYSEEMRGYVYDPDRVQQLLADAGYPGGKGLRPLTLTTNRDGGHRQIALEVARQLGLQGITVQVQEQDWDYYTRQVSNQQLSFFRLGWQADYADADNLLYSLFHSSTAGSNLTGYKNPQVDKLLDEARAEYRDEKARLDLMKRAEEIIVDDAPCLWLFQKKATALIGKDVRDLKLDSTEMINWHEVGLGTS